MNILTKDKFILFLIILNALVLFLISFEPIQRDYYFINYIDLAISFLFIMEMLEKISQSSWGYYIKDNWNKMDFLINLTILPSFALLFISNDIDYFFLTILRLGRIFKFFKFFKFIPNIDHLVRGIIRALRSSVFIIFSFFIYLFIISILSCFIYKGILPEYFGDPLKSIYTIFKIFTTEGWYEIPDLIAQTHSVQVSFFSKIYFVFLLFTGGIGGMSLMNAVIVDELVSDNTESLEREVKELKEIIEISSLDNKKEIKELKSLILELKK